MAAFASCKSKNSAPSTAAPSTAAPSAPTAAVQPKTEPPPVAKLPAPKPPERIPVAFVLTAGAEVVDFAGPWGVFEYVFPPGYEGPAFQLYTVAETAAPLKVSGGMTIVPDYTFANAPAPKVIVVPAQELDPSAAEIAWLQKAAPATDLTMSVCNGAFVLGHAGLLNGKRATSHHNGYALFAATFPEVKVQRGARYVDADGVATAGGLTSGIDLALHVVERYFGRALAEETATALEYQGQGWKDANSNVAFAQKPVSTPDHPICPVCEMEVDKATAMHSTYRGETIYFCSDSDKATFDKSPERFVESKAP
ncbi:MAG TPA: DJ-1/PfpI family protein [Kofleriaceae bacterium]|nr:DJ-1/PfpI family protein [Kofleriaceae bacterium]